MKTTTKIIAFWVLLTVTLAAAFGIGRAVGPVGDATQTHDREGHSMDDGAPKATTTPEGGHDMAAMGTETAIPAGLMTSERGYTFDLASSILPAGTGPVELRILGPDGTAVTDFAVAHEKELHLIAVRRDTSGFQHVHPTMDPGGTWRVDLALTPGTWRLFADFQPQALSQGITLGIDASVAGTFEPLPLPAANRSATVDGYTVSLSGDLVAGASSELTLTVSRGAEPVTDLEPYLGAYGHLVALRTGDLAYLHVHPEGTPSDGETEPGPDVNFAATAPSAGWYRLYLDFRHDGVVRTAEFTLAASAPTTATSETADEGSTTTVAPTMPDETAHDPGHGH